jgi:hypothetical protein
MLAHRSPDLLVVDDQASMAELGANAPPASWLSGFRQGRRASAPPVANPSGDSARMAGRNLLIAAAVLAFDGAGSSGAFATADGRRYGTRNIALAPRRADPDHYSFGAVLSLIAGFLEMS